MSDNRWFLEIVQSANGKYHANMILGGNQLSGLPRDVDYNTLRAAIRARTGVAILEHKDMKFQQKHGKKYAYIDATQPRDDCRVTLEEMEKGWQPLFDTSSLSITKIIGGKEYECFEATKGMLRMELQGTFGDGVDRESVILVPLLLSEAELEELSENWLSEQEKELGFPVGESCSSSSWWVGSSDKSKDALITHTYDHLIPGRDENVGYLSEMASFVLSQANLLLEDKDLTKEDLLHVESNLKDVTKEYLLRCDVWEEENRRELPLSKELEILHQSIFDAVEEVKQAKKSVDDLIKTAAERVAFAQNKREAQLMNEHPTEETVWVCVYKDTLIEHDAIDNLTEICIPTKWLLDILESAGEDLTTWFDEYTADNTEDIAVKAKEEGVILDCTDTDIKELLQKTSSLDTSIQKAALRTKAFNVSHNSNEKQVEQPR